MSDDNVFNEKFMCFLKLSQNTSIKKYQIYGTNKRLVINDCTKNDDEMYQVYIEERGPAPDFVYTKVGEQKILYNKEDLNSFLGKTIYGTLNLEREKLYADIQESSARINLLKDLIDKF